MSYDAAINNQLEIVQYLVDPDIFVLGNKKERRLLLFAAVACEPEAYIGNLLRGGFPRGNLKMDLYIDEEFVWGGPRIYPRHDNIPFGPLELAVNTGNEKIVTLLLDWGADPNHLHSMSLPPAILAIKHERIFKLLLERALSPNLRILGYLRTTVMKEVIKFGKVALAQELLNRDVPIEKTHLLYDAMRGGAPMLEFLLAKGILELPFGSKERELAVLHAIEKFQPSSFNFLIDRGFPVPTEIHPRLLGNLAYIACEAKPISAMIDKMFDSILTHGVKTDTGLTVRDSSPLSNKIRLCRMKCVECPFKKKGADPLYPAYPGQVSDNALFRAANWGYSYCSLGMLRLTLQAIDIHALPRKTLCQEIARCKAMSIEIKWWEGVRTFERFQVKLDNELGCLD